MYLKVPKCEILYLLDTWDFYTIKPPWVGDVGTIKKKNIFVLGMISKVVPRKFWVTLVHAEHELNNFSREQGKKKYYFCPFASLQRIYKNFMLWVFFVCFKKFDKLWLLRVKNCYRMLSMHRKICSAHPACEENF